ncbi:MAG: hypothetical protein AAGM38_07745 [Pseudomonadota bacterium]
MEERRAQARSGVLEMLRASEALSEATIVLGREISETEWDFRGQLRGSAGDRPFYGRVAARCEAELARSACWRISALEVGGASAADGRPDGASDALAALIASTAVGGAAEAPSGDSPRIGGAAPQGEGEIDAAGSRGGDLVDGAPPDAGAEEQGAPASSGSNPDLEAAAPLAEEITTASVPESAGQPPVQRPQPTHVVAGEKINVRQGPGRDFSSAGLAYRGQELFLLESREEWGRFLLIGGPFDNTEGWLFLPLIRGVG